MLRKVRENLNRVKEHGWQVLDLKNCGLKNIPEEIYNYNELTSIDLSNDSFCDEENKNKINTIPNEISNLKKLARLNLSNNEVVNISEGLSLLPNLNYLNLYNNKLTDISEKIP